MNKKPKHGKCRYCKGLTPHPAFDICRGCLVFLELLRTRKYIFRLKFQ